MATAKKAAAKKAPAKKAPAAKKAAPAKKAAATKTTTKVAAKKAAPAKKRTPNAAFMKALTPSPQLAAIVGDKPLPRTEVTKKGLFLRTTSGPSPHFKVEYVIRPKVRPNPTCNSTLGGGGGG